MTPPCPDQARAALKLANDVRGRRAKLKAELKAGRDPRPLLISPPWWLSNNGSAWTVADLLAYLPRSGENRARQLCREAKVPPTRQLQHLSKGERLQLIAAVDRRDARRGLAA